MKEFEEFYKKGRSINGKHTIKNLIVNKKEIIVEGNFTGKWKDGTPIKINFADFFFFNNKGKICERHTYTDQGKV